MPSIRDDARSGLGEAGDPSPGHRAWRWLVRDRRTGRTTLGQRPNLPLAVFLTSRLALAVWHPAPRTEDLVSVIGTVALLWWSVDEVLRGVNPFRRLLGAFVLAAVVRGLIA